MRNIEVVRYQNRLDRLFTQIGTLEGDIELQSHWARYLTVLVSGYLEVAVRAILGQYARHTSSPKVANFVESKLKGFHNPKMEMVLELARLFSQEWEADLRTATEGELKDSIDSIVANRHRIAHGVDVGITFVRIRRYYQNAIKVVALIESHCN